MTIPNDPQIQYRKTRGGGDHEGSVSEIFDAVFGTATGLTPIRGATNWGGQIAGSGGSGASVNDTFIVQTTAGDCPNSQALASLGTGILKSTTGTGVLSIAAGSDLPLMGASGVGHAAGAVPDPGGSAATTHFLREDATWQIPPGGGLTAIANLDLLANISGSSAVPTATTVTALLDAVVGSTQSDLIQRGASTWGVLAPGTADQVLGVGHTGGALEYKTITAGANVTITPTAGTITIASSGGAGGYATVDNAGTPLTQRATINFTGAGVTAADNSGSTRTDVTIPGTVLTPTAVKTTTYSAAAGDFVPCDTTSAGFTVTLPNAPADKSMVSVKHVIQGSTNAVTIACSGSDVFNKTGGSTSATLGLLNQGINLQYSASPKIWYVLADDLPLSQLDARYDTVAYGGTGLNTLTANAVLIGEGTSAVHFATIGTAGRVLVDQGSGADPAFSSVGQVINQWVTVPTALSGSSALNFATVSAYTVTLTASVANTLTISNIAVGQSVTVTTFQGSTGGGTIVWAGSPSIRWSGGTAGQATAGANQGDVFKFYCPQSGIIVGAVAAPNF
jgi:hypothetical protein